MGLGETENSVNSLTINSQNKLQVVSCGFFTQQQTYLLVEKKYKKFLSNIDFIVKYDFDITAYCV